MKALQDFYSKKVLIVGEQDELEKMIGQLANEHNCGLMRCWLDDDGIQVYDVGPRVFKIVEMEE